MQVTCPLRLQHSASLSPFGVLFAAAHDYIELAQTHFGSRLHAAAMLYAQGSHRSGAVLQTLLDPHGQNKTTSLDTPVKGWIPCQMTFGYDAAAGSI